MCRVSASFCIVLSALACVGAWICSPNPNNIGAGTGPCWRVEFVDCAGEAGIVYLNSPSVVPLGSPGQCTANFGFLDPDASTPTYDSSPFGQDLIWAIDQVPSSDPSQDNGWPGPACGFDPVPR